MKENTNLKKLQSDSCQRTKLTTFCITHIINVTVNELQIYCAPLNILTEIWLETLAPMDKCTASLKMKILINGIF